MKKLKIFLFVLISITLLGCFNMKDKSNLTEAKIVEECNFKLIEKKEKINIKKTIFVSKGEYENVFFVGNFDTANRDSIKFVHKCTNCNNSCFKINLRDRLRYDFNKILSNNILTHNEIDNFKIAQKSKLFENSYNMVYGGTPTYSFVKCGECESEYLIVIGLEEKQYGRYQGQAQGMWMIE